MPLSRRAVRIVALPDPPAVWLGYPVPEVAFSCTMIAAWPVTNVKAPRLAG